MTFSFLFCLAFLLRESPYVDQGELQNSRTYDLPAPLKCWDYRLSLSTLFLFGLPHSETGDDSSVLEIEFLSIRFSFFQTQSYYVAPNGPTTCYIPHFCIAHKLIHVFHTSGWLREKKQIKMISWGIWELWDSDFSVHKGNWLKWPSMAFFMVQKRWAVWQIS